MSNNTVIRLMEDNSVLVEECKRLRQENIKLKEFLSKLDKASEFHINKLLKHNNICGHDTEMMRQLLSLFKQGGK
jgi:regulator of replication initiation timing